MVYMVTVWHPVTLHKISSQIPLLGYGVEELRRAKSHQRLAAIKRENGRLLVANGNGIDSFSLAGERIVKFGRIYADRIVQPATTGDEQSPVSQLDHRRIPAVIEHER